MLLAFDQYLVNGVLFSFINSQLNVKGTWLRHQLFCCLYFHLSNMTNPMDIQWLGYMLPPLRQNTVAVCNQHAILILYYINSRLANRLKITDAPIQVPNIFLFYC